MIKSKTKNTVFHKSFQNSTPTNDVPTNKDLNDNIIYKKSLLFFYYN